MKMLHTKAWGGENASLLSLHHPYLPPTLYPLYKMKFVSELVCCESDLRILKVCLKKKEKILTMSFQRAELE